MVDVPKSKGIVVSKIEVEVSQRRVYDDVERFNAALLTTASKLLPELLIEFQKQIVLQVLVGVVNRTPVDTGRARGNWQVSVSTASTSILESRDVVGRETVQKGQDKLASLGFAEIVWISNNLDYVVFLEAGSSNQAPKGMVAITLQEIQSTVLAGS